MGWVGEGDVEDGGGVDEGVDCCEVVGAWVVSRFGMRLIWWFLPRFANRPSLLTAVLGYSGEAIAEYEKAFLSFSDSILLYLAL